MFQRRVCAGIGVLHIEDSLRARHDARMLGSMPSECAAAKEHVRRLSLPRNSVLVAQVRVGVCSFGVILRDPMRLMPLACLLEPDTCAWIRYEARKPRLEYIRKTLGCIRIEGNYLEMRISDEKCP